MVCNKEIQEFLKDNKNLIKAAIQFGSSVSGDYVTNLSDVDLALITLSEQKEKELQKKIKGSFQLQTHIFSSKVFMKRLCSADPLALSILYAGRPICGIKYCDCLRKRGFKPNKSTVRKCMLNSFSALGLAISDLSAGFEYDSVNYAYHAARSAIWASLFLKQITPNNERLLELVKDNTVRNLYQNIIEFRKSIPEPQSSLRTSKLLYSKGNYNDFSQILQNAMTIVKIYYKKLLKKDFLDLFDLLAILRQRFGKPDLYSLMLSVNWKSEELVYLVFLSFKNKQRLMLTIDHQSGRVLSKKLYDDKFE